MSGTLIEFDPRIAPALSLGDEFEVAIRRSVMDPRRWPVVHLVAASSAR